MGTDVGKLIARAEDVLARVEALLPPATSDPDWRKITAARWRKRSGRGYLQGVAHPSAIALSSLVAIDEQKKTIDQNTRQFVAGLPANNVLLTGSRGTGKSSLVKALLARYASKGLRLIEVDKLDLVDLPDIAERIEARPERFVVFCDDLTFDAGEAGYRALKVILDGSIAGAAGNVLIYATSNRRHLLPDRSRRRSRSPSGSGCGSRFIRSDRTSILPLSPHGSIISASRRRPRAATTKRTRAKRCNSRSSAARAAGAWPGSSRKPTPAPGR